MLDNHSPYGGLGAFLLNAIISSEKLRMKKFRKIAIEGYPACGTPNEALKYYKLDSKSLVRYILEKS